MIRVPVIAVLVSSFASGILLINADAAWSLALLPAFPVVLWMPRRGQVLTLHALARSATAFFFFLCVGAIAALPQREEVLESDPFLPPAGETQFSVCLVPGGSDESRSTPAECLLGGGWKRIPLRIFRSETAPSPVGETSWYSGTIRRPGGTRNPGDPDRMVLSRLSGTAALFSIGARDTSGASGEAPDPVPLAAVRSRIDRLFPRTEAGHLVRAMLTGQRDSLSRTTTDSFRESGISHVLAVSGLHVSIVVLLVLLPASFLASWFGLGWTGRTALQLVCVGSLLAVVVSLVGAQPSVVRACLLGVVVVSSRLLDRSGSGTVSALLLSVLLQLAWNTRTLFDAGFLLSHAAVAGLLHVGRSPGIKSTVEASAFATWATAPFVALFFRTIPLAGVVTNLVAIPLTSLIVVSGSLALLFDSLVSGVFSTAAALLAKLLLFAAGQASDRLGFLSVTLDPATIVVPSILLVLLGLRKIALMAGLAALLVTALLAGSIPVRGPFSATILDCGQGDASVLSSPDGEWAVIDTGPPRSRALEDHLRREQVPRIRALFLTHLHADHTGGLPSVSSLVPIDTLYLPVGSNPPDSLLRGVKGMRFLREGDIVRLGREVLIQVLAPTGTESDADPNAYSLVFRVDHGSSSLLFTGDAERASEEAMSTQWDEFVDVDVLKVAHHGSRTSSSPFFAQRVKPVHAVISAGTNSYGLPSAIVIERWKSLGSRVHVTRSDGAFCLTSNGHSFVVGCLD